MTDSNKGLRILVVEDDTEDQELLTELLLASVITIQLLHTAETLAKAIDILQKETFDIIFLDLALPDSSGIDTFKTIKEHTVKTPVIILSGLPDMSIAVEAISLGAQDYHIKGNVDEKILSKTILYSIERNRNLENLREESERFIAFNKAELDLKQSEEITRRIISSALDAIICIDIDGKITVWNPQSEKIFGWKQDEILGKTLTETIIPEEFRARHEQGMKHYQETGKGPILNRLIGMTAMNRAGQQFPVELSIVPLIEGGKRFFCAFIRDITERKKNEEALERIQQNYVSLVNTVDGIVWEADAKTFAFSFVNEKAERLLGYPAEKWIHENGFWGNHIHPDDRKWVLDYCVRCTREMKPYEFEYRMIASDGRAVWLRNIVSVIAEIDEPVQLRGIMIDITEKKYAEAALRSSEQNLLQVLSSTAENFYVIDRDCRITLINESAEKSMSKAWGKLVTIGTNILEAIPPEKIGFIKNKLEQVFAGNKIEYEVHQSIDGLPDWLLVNYNPVNDDKDAIVGAYIVTKDISERKKAEQALIESEERYRSLVEQASDGILVTDLEGTILELNPQLCAMFGYTREEVLQKNVTYFLDPESLKQLPLRLNILQDFKSLLSERRGIRKDGTRFEIELNTNLIGDNKALSIVRNISERKIADEKLKRSEKQLLASIENTPNVAVQWYNKKGEVVFWNHASELIFGWKTEEALGKTLDKLIHTPEEAAAFLATIEQIEKTGETIGPAEFSFRHRDGSTGYCVSTIFSIPSVEGDTCIVCMDVDITERKKAELKLKESEGKYRSVIEQASDFIMITDQQGNFMDANSSFCKTFGYSNEELLQLNINKVIDPEELKISPVRFDLLIKGETILNQRRMLTREGAIIDVEANVKMLPDGRIMAIARDIRERKKAEEQLSNERNLLRALIDHLPDYIYVKDPSFNYLINNRAFVKLVGAASEEENTRKNSIELFGEEIGQINMEEDKKIFETGEKIIDRDEPIITYTGEKLWLLTTKVPLMDQENKVTGILGISKDITDRKKAQQELEESYKAIRKLTEHLQNIREEERAHMAREIHDELGQQLTVLKMDISWINKKMGIQEEPVKERMKELLVMLDETVRSVRRISSELRPSLLDDLGLIAAMEWQLTEFEKRFEIKTYFKPGNAEIKLPESMKTGLFRILQESLTNVARHSNAKKVTVTLNMENGSIVLSVADNGVGFDKLNTTGKKTLGILGMQERTSMMGGTYEINGKPGKGTRVLVTIPLDDSNKN